MTRDITNKKNFSAYLLLYLTLLTSANAIGSTCAILLSFDGKTFSHTNCGGWVEKYSYLKEFHIFFFKFVKTWSNKKIKILTILTYVFLNKRKDKLQSWWCLEQGNLNGLFQCLKATPPQIYQVQLFRTRLFWKIPYVALSQK